MAGIIAVFFLFAGPACIGVVSAYAEMVEKKNNINVCGPVNGYLFSTLGAVLPPLAFVTVVVKNAPAIEGVALLLAILFTAIFLVSTPVFLFIVIEGVARLWMRKTHPETEFSYLPWPLHRVKL